MKSSKPTKKRADELVRTEIREMELTPEDWREFERGVQLFNSGKFWHSHEAWEEIWKRHAEDERLFFQGIIQLAAAYHQLVAKKSFKGMMNNFDKAYEKLQIYQPEYLGVEVESVLRSIEASKTEIERIGPDELESFNFQLIPKLQFRKPTNPDLIVGMRDVVRSDEFSEGMRNFNAGYYWEAHEIWEDLWRAQETETKDFAQSFVQLASGYSFLKLSKFAPAKYLFEKAIEKFREFEYLDSGVELTLLIGQLEEAIAFIDGGHVNGNSNGKLPKPMLKLKGPNGQIALN